MALVVFLFPRLDDEMEWKGWNGGDSNYEQILRWVAKNKHGCLLLHFGACRQGSRQACPHRHQQWPALLEEVCLQENTNILSPVASALLLEDSDSEEVLAQVLGGEERWLFSRSIL